ncbi:NAD(P)H-dependent oxidoreductase [Alkaliphilus serpentinus]|uniref:NAD(P)H-dependent oxidoreductase n=1 Tax=Alkaliphilus serpentinus TaxID=1482731 RepID=A0A833HPD7_9FIRM|nr:NAD(P)H-dependent oxidoreductase [Alkaliphilus serpentinus]KAB3530552.1 NAD(P)H-dependent oxidoreductase [Alkaliphilus serpentinus]
MLYVIKSPKLSQQLKNMMERALEGIDYKIIDSTHKLEDLKNKKILFVVQLDNIGACLPIMEILSTLASEEEPLKGSTAGILIQSNSQLYTKSAASHIVFIANSLGCSFIGHPMVEATDDLRNFLTWQKVMDSSLEEISLERSKTLTERLLSEKVLPIENPKLVAIHSSFRKTSNTLRLWSMTAEHLKDYKIQELHVENGSVYDCYGCPYKTCKAYGLNDSCYYGGVMIEEIIPTIEGADGIIWICPNYNDSLSSNLLAVINRLTSLYRKISFNEKRLHSIIVSGNSGSDSLARQLIDALNINKGFYLPANFSLMETGNDKGAIERLPGIEGRAKKFAERIKESYF